MGAFMGSVRRNAALPAFGFRASWLYRRSGSTLRVPPPEAEGWLRGYGAVVGVGMPPKRESSSTRSTVWMIHPITQTPTALSVLV